jgi:hypothetical protein
MWYFCCLCLYLREVYNKMVGEPLKKAKRKVVSRSGGKIENETAYCRKCMKMVNKKNFFQAVDLNWIDSNGLLGSICKDCMNSLFDNIYESNHSLDKTILKLCRSLNIKFDTNAIEALRIHLETAKNNNRDINALFGVYLGKLRNVQKTTIGERQAEDLTYTDVVGSGVVLPDITDYESIPHDVIQVWGKGYTEEEYQWLEEKLASWKKTHKSDTMGEETLLTEIVFKQYEIKKAREEERSTAALVKELQDLMKTASVDPAKTAIAGSGKSQDTFSSFIKTIEENEPAEFFEDKGMFKDVENIDYYFKKYVVRSIKNFITGSRDFNVESDIDNEDDDDAAIDEIIAETLNNNE